MEVKDEAVFENVGQAVHVSFLIMAQEAKQDAPLRAALIRAMESVQLSGRQSCWLDQLRGEASGSINFGGLDGNEVRAQCAMVLQAVKHRLSMPEMWVLQAKFGQTDYEDVVSDVAGHAGAMTAAVLMPAQERVVLAQQRLAELSVVKEIAIKEAARNLVRRASADVERARADVLAAEKEARSIREAIAQVNAPKGMDNGRPYRFKPVSHRRFAFSAERIAAIQGLTDYLAPLIPTVPALAVDCLLGLIFANHKKLDITYRDIAQSFGGSHVKYFRAAVKLKKHLRELEQVALHRLEAHFVEQGVTNQ